MSLSPGPAQHDLLLVDMIDMTCLESCLNNSMLLFAVPACCRRCRLLMFPPNLLCQLWREVPKLRSHYTYYAISCVAPFLSLLDPHVVCLNLCFWFVSLVKSLLQLALSRNQSPFHLKPGGRHFLCCGRSSLRTLCSETCKQPKSSRFSWHWKIPCDMKCSLDWKKSSIPWIWKSCSSW